MGAWLYSGAHELTGRSAYFVRIMNEVPTTVIACPSHHLGGQDVFRLTASVHSCAFSTLMSRSITQYRNEAERLLMFYRSNLATGK